MSARAGPVTRTKWVVIQTGGSGGNDHEIDTVVKKLGGRNSAFIPPDMKCVLVIKPPFARTLKVLTMLARGLPIVTQNWIFESQKAGKFLEPCNYLLCDKEFEHKYQLKIQECLENRQNGSPVFEGWTIVSTPSTKPFGQDLQGVVQSAGANFIFNKPEVWPKPSLLVTCEEDRKLWPDYLGKTAETYKPKLVTVSAIWESIQQQQIVTDGHELYAKKRRERSKTL